MPRKRRFIVSFKDVSKASFLSMASNTLTGIGGNPDFADAPVTELQFKAAYDPMVAAAPNAVRNNIDGLRVFKPLRIAVEGKMTQLGTYAQGVIGNNPTRMLASGLPLTKDPEARPEDINETVLSPRVEHGSVAGNVKVSVRPLRAADGIIIEERKPDMTFVEKAKVNGFRANINGYDGDEVVVLQIRYWNNAGAGPRMGRPMAIVA